MMNAPAPLKRRLIALIYEAMLIGAVSAIAGIVAGIADTLIIRTVPQLRALTPFLTMLVLLAAWWLYFRLNWQREGQTLAMRAWKIGLTDRHGNRPDLKRLRTRFTWACIFLVFLPLCAYAALRQFALPPKTAAAMAVLWWILPWGFALLNPRRQFLYDYLSGTELRDWREK